VRDDLRRVATLTSGIAEMTRNRAEDFVRSWVGSGDLRRESAGALVRDLVDWSAANGKEMASFVRSEVKAQLGTLGVASKSDVERLEKRLERLEETLRRKAAKAAPRKSVKKTTSSRKKTAARRATRSATAARAQRSGGGTS
jgi:polyhydroxyalkanoate synthesis regulator phasin